MVSKFKIVQTFLGNVATLDDLAFCPVLKARYESPATESLSSINNLAAIRKCFNELKPQCTLELGLGEAGSVTVFAACHKTLGHAPAQQHVAIDPFQYSLSKGRGGQLLECAGLAGYVETVISSAQIALPKMVEERRSFGIIYIDAAKRADDIMCMFYFAKLMLDKGGFLLIDDCACPGVRSLLRHIARNERKFFEGVPRSHYRDVGTIGEIIFCVAKRFGKVNMAAFRKCADYPALDDVCQAEY